MSSESTPEDQLPGLEVSHETLKIKIASFTEAKNIHQPEQNEDLFRFLDNSFVLVDGSTAKEGTKDVFDIYGKSGGQVAAEIACQAVIESDLNGLELVHFVSDWLRAEYAARYPEALKDPRRRFAATLLAARIAGENLVVTQVGDSGFRINSGEVYAERRKIDELDAQARAVAIAQALAEGMDEIEAVEKGREYITPSLKRQYLFRNNPDHWLGFAYIDGGEVPAKFINTYLFPLSDVSTLEIFSDGYFSYPAASTIEAWEAEYASAQQADPNRYKEYLATKPADDRTIAVIEFAHLGQDSAA